MAPSGIITDEVILCCCNITDNVPDLGTKTDGIEDLLVLANPPFVLSFPRPSWLYECVIDEVVVVVVVVVVAVVILADIVMPSEDDVRTAFDEFKLKLLLTKSI